MARPSRTSVLSVQDIPGDYPSRTGASTSIRSRTHSSGSTWTHPASRIRTASTPLYELVPYRHNHEDGGVSSPNGVGGTNSNSTSSKKNSRIIIVETGDDHTDEHDVVVVGHDEDHNSSNQALHYRRPATSSVVLSTVENHNLLGLPDHDTATITSNHHCNNSSSISNKYVSMDDAIERLQMGRFQLQILWACGLCFAADAMEVLLLSFLAIVLQVEWDLSQIQTSTLTSLVFVGALLGTLTLGPLGDYYGRKPIFTLTAGMIAVFGIATSLVFKYPTLLIIRFMVGFGVGGLTIPFDTLAEFLPTSHRGSNLLLIEYFWTAGTLLTPILAYGTLGLLGTSNTNISWRLFVALCSIPCIISTIIGLKLVPESPRWLLTQGKHDTALDILRQAVRINGHDPIQVFPPGTQLLHDDDPRVLAHNSSDSPDEEGEDDDELDDATDYTKRARRGAGVPAPVTPPIKHYNSNFWELLSPSWRRITLLLWVAWAGLAFVYYGTIMIITRVFATTTTPDSDGLSTNATAALTDSPSSTLTSSSGVDYSFDYGAILVSASAEIAGTTLVLLTVDKVGRVISQSVCYVLGGIAIFMLCWLASDEIDDPVSTSRSSLIVSAFLARLFFMAATCTTWVSTAELFTTEIRTTGHAASNAVARLGGAMSPFLLQSASSSYQLTGSIMLVISIITAIATWHLPETAGKGMGVRTIPEPSDDSDGIVLMHRPNSSRTPSESESAGEGRQNPSSRGVV